MLQIFSSFRKKYSLPNFLVCLKSYKAEIEICRFLQYYVIYITGRKEKKILFVSIL
jgi:hypothetical protein